MSDIVERLRIHSDTEEVMRAWDRLRAYLLDGNKGSYARDIFEAILSHIDEGREEAADEIELLRKSVEAAYLAGFQASCQGWNGEHGCFYPEEDNAFIRKRDQFFQSIEEDGK